MLLKLYLLCHILVAKARSELQVLVAEAKSALLRPDPGCQLVVDEA